MNTRVGTSRVGLALLTTFALVIAMMIVMTDPAAGSHIDATGPLESNCVDFQVNDTGTESPIAYDGDPASESDVNITLVSWDADLKGFNFSVSGLPADHHVVVSIKSGTFVEEKGPFGNGGPYHVTNSVAPDEQHHDISHIRICVFMNQVTTSTSTTTTTVAPTTTTTVAPTTTTTIPDEVLGTVITTSTTAPVVAVTTTIPDEVLDTHVEAEELPFTGLESDQLLGLAVLLLAGGLLALGVTGRREES